MTREEFHAMRTDAKEYIDQKAESDRLREQLALVKEHEQSLSDRADMMSEALEAVEWVDGLCPWCDGTEPRRKTGVNQFGKFIDFGVVGGHAPDCARQRALGKEGK